MGREEFRIEPQPVSDVEPGGPARRKSRVAAVFWVLVAGALGVSGVFVLKRQAYMASRMPPERWTAEFHYVGHGFPLGMSVATSKRVVADSGPPPGARLPRFRSSVQRYGAFVLNGTRLPFVQDGEGSRLAALHFDLNRNGDYTDDAASFRPQKRGEIHGEAATTIPYPEEGGAEEPYDFWFFTRSSLPSFYPRCHRRSEFDYLGGPYVMVLFDANSDGDYSNDPLAIDLDGDGKVSNGETAHQGGVIRVDGVKLRVEKIAPSGRTVTFRTLGRG